MVAYTDSLVDFDTLARFVQAYQRVCPLLIGELWAVAITLRIVLFEQLRLLAVRLGDTMTQLQRANKIADDLLLMVSKPSITASDIVHQLSSNLGPQQELQRTLIVQLAQRLRDQDPIIRPAFTWSTTEHTTTQPQWWLHSSRISSSAQVFLLTTLPLPSAVRRCVTSAFRCRC